MKKLILILIMLLALVNVASAITTYAEWENKKQEITINYDEKVYFDYALFSVNPPIRYSIKMYDADTNLVKTFIDTSSQENLVSNRQYVSKEDYVKDGRYSIIVQGYDAKQDASSSILLLQVNPIIKINHPPALNPIGNKEIKENELLEFKITASDPDNDNIILKAENLPRQARFRDNKDSTGLFTWQTNFEDAGNYKIKFIVSDSKLEDFEDITIKVIDVLRNNPPNIKIIAPKENEIISGNYNILWQANDPDQATNTLDIKLEYRKKIGLFDSILNILGLDNWIILEDARDNNDGSFTWDTKKVSNGNYELRATVTDDQNAKAIANVNSFIIKNIIVVNRPPRIISTPITEAFVNELYSYKVEATDPDNDVLTYSLAIFPGGMKIDDKGLIRWTPYEKGIYQVIVKVSDGKLEDKQEFDIEVKERIIPPPPVPPPITKIFNIHKIQINNIILTYDNNLNVFINLKNQSNKKENIKIKTTIINNGLHKEEKVKLNVNQGIWKLTEFNLPKKNYVVKVEIISKHDKDVKYAYLS